MKQRHDIYALVHKGLRAWTGQILVELGRLDAQDGAEIAELVPRVRAWLVAARDHLDHEERFIHPALEAAQPGSTVQTLDEHEHHRAELAELEAGIERLAAQPSHEAATQLYRALADHLAETLAHMKLEESVNNAVLWAHYDDGQIAGVEARLVGSIPPVQMMAYLRHMIPAMAPLERVALLGGMQRALPWTAFGAILGELKPGLSARDWFKLMLGLGPMPVSA